MNDLVLVPSSPTLHNTASLAARSESDITLEYSFERRLLDNLSSPQSSAKDDWDWIPLDSNSIHNKTIQKKNITTQQYKIEKKESIHTTLSTKSVVKNYGNAIGSFASSKLALPYLEKMLANQNLTPREFQKCVSDKKISMCNINNLREMLTELCNDTEKERLFKRVFKQIAEIFIKYFSVNWIFHGKLKHKETHLKYRFKMLRRIQRPELFTYLKEKSKH